MTKKASSKKWLILRLTLFNTLKDIFKMFLVAFYIVVFFVILLWPTILISDFNFLVMLQVFWFMFVGVFIHFFSKNYDKFKVIFK